MVFGTRCFTVQEHHGDLQVGNASLSLSRLSMFAEVYRVVSLQPWFGLLADTEILTEFLLESVGEHMSWLLHDSTPLS